MAAIDEVKKNLKSQSLVLGSERVIKNLKLGNAQKVFLSSNCPNDVEKAINYYAKLSECEVSKIEYANDELGVICKKPFAISVLGFLKSAK